MKKRGSSDKFSGTVKYSSPPISEKFMMAGSSLPLKSGDAMSDIVGFLNLER